MFLLIPGRWSTSPILRRSSDFCSSIPVPSQTSLGNGARVKVTGSHEEGWEQEVMCRQWSPRCQGMSTLFAEVEEEEGRGGDAEDRLIRRVRAAPGTGLSGCSLAAAVPCNSMGVFLNQTLKDKGCLVR